MDGTAVEWAALDAAHGPATEVPELISQLSSDSPTERLDAHAELWGVLCHQGTVYEASAAAVPMLYAAAQAVGLPTDERDDLLALLTHIGLGDDTTWEGYSPWAVVEECARAAEQVLPDLARWALRADNGVRQWTLAMVFYHPVAWAGVGLDVHQLTPDADRAVVALVRAALAGEPPLPAVLEDVLKVDADVRGYFDEVISEAEESKRARQLVLELALSGKLLPR